MLTVLTLCVIFLVAAFAIMLFAGLITVTFPLLLLGGFVLIDIMALKWIFCRKKKK